MITIVFLICVVAFLWVLGRAERFIVGQRAYGDCAECGRDATCAPDGVPLCDPCARMHEQEEVWP